jgi:hypothetical protein
VRSVNDLLIFGGFLSAPSDKRKEASHARLKAALGVLVGMTIWIITWVFPLTFMVAMVSGCDTSARALGCRALIFYASDADSARAAIAAAKRDKERGHIKRQILRSTALIRSLAIPIGFIADIDHQRQSSGITGLTAVGALVALALVIATAVVAAHR